MTSPLKVTTLVVSASLLAAQPVEVRVPVQTLAPLEVRSTVRASSAPGGFIVPSQSPRAMTTAAALGNLVAPVPSRGRNEVGHSISHGGFPGVPLLQSLVSVAPADADKEFKMTSMPLEATPTARHSFMRGLARVLGGRVEPRLSRDDDMTDLEQALLELSALTSKAARR